jgi:hypothetical protein
VIVVPSAPKRFATASRRGYVSGCLFCAPRVPVQDEPTTTALALADHWATLSPLHREIIVNLAARWAAQAQAQPDAGPDDA